MSSLYVLYLSFRNDIIFIENPHFWFTFEIVTKLYRNRVLYYILHLELIQSELEIIEEMAKDAVQSEYFQKNGIVEG